MLNSYSNLISVQGSPSAVSLQEVIELFALGAQPKSVQKALTLLYQSIDSDGANPDSITLAYIAIAYLHNERLALPDALNAMRRALSAYTYSSKNTFLELELRNMSSYILLATGDFEGSIEQTKYARL